MGGLGKTSLAQHVFNDPRIEGKFDMIAWISVPQEFDVLNVSRVIKTQLLVQLMIFYRKKWCRED